MDKSGRLGFDLGQDHFTRLGKFAYMGPHIPGYRLRVPAARNGPYIKLIGVLGEPGRPGYLGRLLPFLYIRKEGTDMEPVLCRLNSRMDLIGRDIPGTSRLPDSQGECKACLNMAADKRSRILYSRA